MKKGELDKRMIETAKMILSYCTARTSDHFEAEDLAQDIILEIYKSAETIRNDDAFYGFMWAVAGNVYKQWCRKQAKDKGHALHDGLTAAEPVLDEESDDVYLLRRELALLSERYRRAVILYYIENKNCTEISNLLEVSEGMVKYLLFKSRQILKEGMRMERNYGEQSYNPKKMTLLSWGSGGDREAYYALCANKIAQNILFACYNDRLTAKQLSLEIGVALPYMEDTLEKLHAYELLRKDGKRFSTNIVIFTKDFTKEVTAKTAKLRESITEMIIETIAVKKAEIMKIGFKGAEMSENVFAWQMVCFLLYQAVFEILPGKIKPVYPETELGGACFFWGVEDCEASAWESNFAFGISNSVNARGDYIQFMDFPINGGMVHHYFSGRQNAVNVFLDIAGGNTAACSENDRAAAAEMVRKGYLISGEDGLSVNVPIFTKAQHKKLKMIFAEPSARIAEEAEMMMDTVTKILKNHVPVHLKNLVKEMAYLRLFEDVAAAPVTSLVERKFLLPYSGESLLPTTYVILQQDDIVHRDF